MDVTAAGQKGTKCDNTVKKLITYKDTTFFYITAFLKYANEAVSNGQGFSCVEKYLAPPREVLMSAKGKSSAPK